MWPLGAWLLKGTLQEAAVSAYDLVKGVSGELGESGRAVDDGVVVARGVRDGKRTAEINGADVHCWVRA